jgi:SNF2 family DNA or RNA helicase
LLVLTRIGAAHYIRNGSTARHKAVVSLKAQHRWCLTGTPIFNRAEDLWSLLNFLHVYPFNFQTFSNYISRPLKHDPDTGLANLKSLVKAISLRRTKRSILEDLEIPPRKDRTEMVAFTSEERLMYEKLRSFLTSSLSPSAKANATPNRLITTMLRLRQFCNHGIEMFPPAIASSFKSWDQYERPTAPLLDDSDVCVECRKSPSELKSGYLAGVHALQCGHQLCAGCNNRRSLDDRDHTETCHICFGFEGDDSFTEGKNGEAAINQLRYEPSSKVRALVRNLKIEEESSITGAGLKRFDSVNLC